MSEPTVWWLVCGAAIAVELVTGTFYLLMLALGRAGAALSAHAGYGLTVQILVAAVVGGGAVMGWHVKQMKKPSEALAQANPNVLLDIGETLQINSWNSDGTADVQYRGAHWTAVHRPGVVPSPGPHRLAEVIGNRLLVEKA
jgi:membrane protein implicated in regulation of membrane protease activity